MSAMSNQIYNNNVSRVITKSSEGLVSGRGPVCEWADLSRQSDTVILNKIIKIVPPLEKEKIENGYVHNGMLLS